MLHSCSLADAAYMLRFHQVQPAVLQTTYDSVRLLADRKLEWLLNPGTATYSSWPGASGRGHAAETTPGRLASGPKASALSLAVSKGRTDILKALLQVASASTLCGIEPTDNAIRDFLTGPNCATRVYVSRHWSSRCDPELVSQLFVIFCISRLGVDDVRRCGKQTYAWPMTLASNHDGARRRSCRQDSANEDSCLNRNLTAPGLKSVLDRIARPMSQLGMYSVKVLYPTSSSSRDNVVFQLIVSALY
jgi:hypothetical protein